jgi:hypothetical protein
VSALAQARFPNAPDQAQIWAQALKQWLWDGESWRVIAQARAVGLPTSYFEQHQRRLDDPAFRAQGYPMGSGTTESGVKHYKQRFCAAGMRWSRRGVERMVIVRSVVMEAAFDHRWAAA